MRQTVHEGVGPVDDWYDTHCFFPFVEKTSTQASNKRKTKCYWELLLKLLAIESPVANRPTVISGGGTVFSLWVNVLADCTVPTPPLSVPNASRNNVLSSFANPFCNMLTMAASAVMILLVSSTAEVYLED